MKRWLTIVFVLVLLCCMPAALAAEGELIQNGGFEMLNAEGEPIDWVMKAYRSQEGYSRISVTDQRAHSGSYSAVIESASYNDARYVYTVNVEPNSLYRMSAYVLVDYMGEEGNGANLSIENIYAYSGKLFDTGGEWQYIEWYGETGPEQRQLSISVRVGGYGAESVGKAYFDDVSLMRVDGLPFDTTAAIWYSTKSESASGNAASGPQKSTALFILCALAFAALFVLIRRMLGAKPDKRASIAFWCLMTVGLALRLVLSANVAGYSVDINCFTSWSLRMADAGPAAFYTDGHFCDYPPGYMLLLWPCGAVLRAVGYSASSLSLVIVKSVPVICDMLGALLLYSFAKKRISNIAAAALSALYLLNPAVLVNGSAWGQADSVLALLITITAIYAMKNSWRVAVPLFIVSLLVKPQALLFAPVGGVWLIICIMTDKRGLKKALYDVLIGLGVGLVAAVAIVLPFSLRQARPVGWLIDLYRSTLASYASATLNTANLYYLAGANWVSLEEAVPFALPAATALALAAAGTLLLVVSMRENKALKENSHDNAHWYLGKKALCGFATLALAAFAEVLSFTGASYELFGYAMMVYACAIPIICLIKDGEPGKLPFYMALSLIGIYVIGIKVHERYLFPALLLLLMSYITTRDRRALWIMLGFSLTTFINTAVVLDNSILFGSSMGHLNSDTMTLNIILCIANIALMGFAMYTAMFPPLPLKQSHECEKQEPAVESVSPPAYVDMLLSPRDAKMRLGLRDYLIMSITAILYGVLALTNLGSTVAPQAGWVSTSPDEQIVFELDEPADFKLMYYAGVSYNDFSIAVSEDGVSWSVDYPCEMRQGLCYQWRYALQSETFDDKVIYSSDDPNGVLWLQGKYLRLNACEAGLNLFEIALRDKNGDNLPVRIVSHTGANPGLLDEDKPADRLIDEQYTCVGEPSWYNGMYFDEIYHARTAYEHLHGQTPYETTHPPLGKLLMSAAISVFGMTPFGWRFAGAFIGILMLPALYLLAMQLTKKRSTATIAMLAFALDLMHFTQTRIATIDSFPVFFIILTYLCMARYMQADTFGVAEGEKPALISRAYLKSLIPLALCGFFMGLSIASKWIGLYSAVGLALLFFGAAYRQYRAGLVAFNYDTEANDSRLTLNQRLRVKTAQDFALKRIFLTCGFCVLFFILVPCVIYYLCYIPYLSPNGAPSIERVVEAQEGMLRYHSTPGLGMDHPFQSPWWQWPFLMKPIWFNQDKFEPEGFASTIMSMGNPWIYYIGAFCMLAVLIYAVARYVRIRGGLKLKHGDGDMTLAVLAVGFLAQYLPWMLVPRSMYMYHYFASVPFIILATAWAISRIRDSSIRLGVSVGYILVAAGFFVAFFPYASGALTDVGWLQAVKEFFAWPSGLASGFKYLFRIYY